RWSYFVGPRLFGCFPLRLKEKDLWIRLAPDDQRRALDAAGFVPHRRLAGSGWVECSVESPRDVGRAIRWLRRSYHTALAAVEREEREPCAPAWRVLGTRPSGPRARLRSLGIARPGFDAIDAHEWHQPPRCRGKRARDQNERRVAVPVVQPPPDVLRELGAAVEHGHEQREERRLNVARAGFRGEVEERELGDHADRAERDLDGERGPGAAIAQIGERGDDAGSDRPVDQAPERHAARERRIGEGAEDTRDRAERAQVTDELLAEPERVGLIEEKRWPERGAEVVEEDEAGDDPDLALAQG